MFRAASIQIENPKSHDTIKPIIQRTLSLKNPPSHGSRNENDTASFYKNDGHEQAADENPVFNHLLNKIDAQGERVELLETAGLQVVASLNRSLQHIDDNIGIIKDDMTQTKRELSNNSSYTRKLANDVLTSQTEITEVKRALQPLPVKGHLEKEQLSIETSITEAKTSLRVELGDMCEAYLQKANLFGSKLENIQQDLKVFQTTAHAALLVSNTNIEEIAALKSELDRLKQDRARAIVQILFYEHGFRLT